MDQQNYNIEMPNQAQQQYQNQNVNINNFYNPPAEEEIPNNQNIQINNENNIVDANKEKYFFFKFLMYNSKIEMHLEYLSNVIFWSSILEIVTWTICLILFFTDVKMFATIWAQILHVPRGAIGFVILKLIPSSFQVLDNLEDTEKESLLEVQEKLLNNFLEILKENEPKLKPFLVTYLVLSVFCLLIDPILFISLLVSWGKEGYEFMNILQLILIVIFISKLIYNFSV